MSLLYFTSKARARGGEWGGALCDEEYGGRHGAGVLVCDALQQPAPLEHNGTLALQVGGGHAPNVLVVHWVMYQDNGTLAPTAGEGGHPTVVVIVGHGNPTAPSASACACASY